MNEYIRRIFKKKEASFYTVWGIIIGLLLFIYPAALFYVTTIIIVAYFIYNRVDDHEKVFILRIFFFALLLRWVLIIVTHILSAYYGFGPKLDLFPGMEGGALIGDDGAIHRGSWALAKMISGVQLSEKEAKNLFNVGEYGWSLHYYLLGFFYYLFGYVPILGKCISALFGALTGIIVYFISKELFGIKTAKLACTLTVLYPTLFLWSITNLKDTTLIFLLILIAYSFIMFFKRRRIGYLFLLPVLFFSISYYRSGLLFLLILAAVTSFIINIRWKYKKFVISIVILAFFLNSHFIYKHCSNCVKSMPGKITIEKFIGIQRGNVNSGGTVYKIYPERFYKLGDSKPINTKEVVISLLKGTLSLMFKPFPWEIDKKSILFYYPVSMIWDTLFLFFIIGLLVSIRYHFKDSIFLVSTFIIILVWLSLAEGNVGTVIRHRDMITPIYIIFSSLGIVRLLSQKQFGRVK